MNLINRVELFGLFSGCVIHQLIHYCVNNPIDESITRLLNLKVKQIIDENQVEVNNYTLDLI